MAMPVLATDISPTVDEIRDRVLEALRQMLIQAEDESLELSVLDGVGLAVKLEHDSVHCMLIFDELVGTHSLSPREMQIARLVARGATNRVIASTLDISSWTVSTHLRRVFAKLGVSNRAEMVNQLFAPGARFDVPHTSR
jgi:DNA-binding CsgD family transcriptional regulator